MARRRTTRCSVMFSAPINGQLKQHFGPAMSAQRSELIRQAIGPESVSSSPTSLMCAFWPARILCDYWAFNNHGIRVWRPGPDTIVSNLCPPEANAAIHLISSESMYYSCCVIHSVRFFVYVPVRLELIVGAGMGAKRMHKHIRMRNGNVKIKKFSTKYQKQ